jgi:hypothetical protein
MMEKINIRGSQSSKIHTLYCISVALLLVPLVLAGCKTRLPDDMPDIGVPEPEINSRMRLWVYGASNDPVVKNKKGVLIGVEIKPPDQIEFARDFGVRLFLYDDDKWFEIENATSYNNLSNNTVILPLEGLDPTGSAILAPYYPNLKKSTPLRIVLIGRLVRDGVATEEKTAGYIDVMLKP